MKIPAISQAIALFSHHKKGITPNRGGLRQETAFYRVAMLALESLTAEAEGWYMKQREAKK
jgi:hypothetical protein